MILTKENLTEWKIELDKECVKQGLLNYKLSETLNDNDWLLEHIGYDTSDVVYEERTCI